MESHRATTSARDKAPLFKYWLILVPSNLNFVADQSTALHNLQRAWTWSHCSHKALKVWADKVCTHTSLSQLGGQQRRSICPILQQRCFSKGSIRCYARRAATAPTPVCGEGKWPPLLWSGAWSSARTCQPPSGGLLSGYFRLLGLQVCSQDQSQPLFVGPLQSPAELFVFHENLKNVRIWSHLQPF